MARITAVSTWILDGETTFEEGDKVVLTTTSGECVKGEIYNISSSYIEIESTQLGNVTIDIDYIEDITK